MILIVTIKRDGSRVDSVGVLERGAGKARGTRRYEVGRWVDGDWLALGVVEFPPDVGDHVLASAALQQAATADFEAATKLLAETEGEV
jgi:hypothetical protein